MLKILAVYLSGGTGVNCINFYSGYLVYESRFECRILQMQSRCFKHGSMRSGKACVMNNA
jgi:hypothetical protein